MKFILLLVILIVPLSAAVKKSPTITKLPEDIELASGRILRDVSVVRWERERVVLKHAGGTEPVPFTLIKNVSLASLQKMADKGRTAQKANQAPKSPAQESDQIPREVSDKVRTHAENYYKDSRRNGSGSTLVFEIRIDLDDPRAIPGWTGRYEVEGVAGYQYYESIWGGSFTSASHRFSAQVEKQPSGSYKIIDFINKS